MITFPFSDVKGFPEKSKKANEKKEDLYKNRLKGKTSQKNKKECTFMQKELLGSETAKNLMRAFAGESQARNRYTFAAGVAKKSGLYAISEIFRFTAEQEKEHAEIFYKHLSSLAGETLHIDGGYPVDISDDVGVLLSAASHNEYEESDIVYRAFGETARSEGFLTVAASFFSIAAIEKIHGNRFAEVARLLSSGKWFTGDGEEPFLCLNCGHIHKGKEVPSVCPVCQHDRGYFIRTSLAPYTSAALLRLSENTVKM